MFYLQSLGECVEKAEVSPVSKVKSKDNHFEADWLVLIQRLKFKSKFGHQVQIVKRLWCFLRFICISEHIDKTENTVLILFQNLLFQKHIQQHSRNQSVLPHKKSTYVILEIVKCIHLTALIYANTIKSFQNCRQKTFTPRLLEGPRHVGA